MILHPGLKKCKLNENNIISHTNPNKCRKRKYFSGLIPVSSIKKHKLSFNDSEWINDNTKTNLNDSVRSQLVNRISFACPRRDQYTKDIIYQSTFKWITK